MTEKGREKVKKRTGKLLNSFVVLTIVLSVLAASVTSVSALPLVPKPTEIVVTASPSSIPAEVGSTSTITATVINWTNKDTHPTPVDFQIYFEIVEPTSGTSISPGQNMTDGDGNASATLTAGPGVAPGTVTVKATAEGGEADPVNTTITLISEYGVELTVDQAERTTAPGVNATYTLTVKNTGTLPDSYTLSVDNVNSADVADLSTGSITDLGAGDTADVLLTVRDADIGTYIVNVTVTGTSVSDMVTTKTIVSVDTEPPIVTNPTADPQTIPEDTDNEPLWGELANLSVVVTDESTITSVTIDLSAIGGATQAMTPTSDNIWYYETNASVDSAIFEAGSYVPHQLQVNATDVTGKSNTSVSIELLVMKNGDVRPYDGDGTVDFMHDALYLVRHTKGVTGYEDIRDNIADVTGDGTVDFMHDALYLVRHTKGVTGYEILK